MDHDKQAEARLPIGKVLPEIKIQPIDDPVDFVFVLARTGAGSTDAGWSYQTSSAPNREELLGALIIQVELLKREVMQDWD